jgi:hypothetical protein
LECCGLAQLSPILLFFQLSQNISVYQAKGESGVKPPHSKLTPKLNLTPTPLPFILAPS